MCHIQAPATVGGGLGKTEDPNDGLHVTGMTLHRLGQQQIKTLVEEAQHSLRYRSLHLAR